MKFISLFAGIGGLDWGLMQAGMECVGYVEMDKFAHQAYQVLHDPRKEMWSAYDIRDVTDDDIRCLGRERGHISLIAAGFPCQSFSVAGKREGFADRTRGTLFFEVARFASILRPEHLLLENVDGLRNHDNGRTLGIILSTLDELGYDTEWQVLNSAGWVPQNRERIYLVASIRGCDAGKVFPFGRENINAIEVVGRIEGNHDQNSRVYGTRGVAPTLSTMQGGGQEPKIVIVGNVNPSGNGMNGNVFDAEGLSPTLTTNKGEGNKVLVNVSQVTGVAETDRSLCLDANYFKGLGANQARTGVMEPRAVLTPDRMEKRQNGRRMEELGEPTFTLTAQDLHGVAIPNDIEIIDMYNKRKRTDGNIGTLTANSNTSFTHSGTFGIYNGDRIRKLTPLECFRLQSYPDWWYVTLKLFRHPEYIKQVDMSQNDITAQVLEITRTNGLKEGISDSQLYKMAGNGVTSVVAYEIGMRLQLSM